MRGEPGVPVAGTGAWPLRDPVGHLHVVPLTRALGARWGGIQTGTATLHLPYSQAICNPATGGIDERAIMALLDHACSSAIYARITRSPPIATLDLRVAFQRDAPAAADAIVTAHATHITETVAFVSAAAHAGEGAAHAGEGAALATCSATFFIGSSPGGEREGGAAGIGKPARDFDIGDLSRVRSFEEFLGLARHGSHVRMEFADRLVGAVSLPALHGGAVASLLVSAGRTAALAEPGRAGRLAAITVQYLRAGRAEATTATAVAEKRGARSAVLSVTAKQAHGSRVVATAQCIFVASE